MKAPIKVECPSQPGTAAHYAMEELQEAAGRFEELKALIFLGTRSKNIEITDNTVKVDCYDASVIYFKDSDQKK